ncbi:MAG: leucyl/phenylalanyl-tRNA--protein transferase [Desulfuromonadaceae bacterium]
MPVFTLSSELAFPPTHLAEGNGLLAVGGDLSPERILLAYTRGIFPWNNPDEPLLWWAPPQRCVLLPHNIHLSRSLKKKLRKNPYRITIDADFSQCIHHCAHAQERDEQTWITSEMQEAYNALHTLGFAHSVECWDKNEMVGGLYGIALGECFCGESMFHRRTDASKIAFAALATHLLEHQYRVIDCQMPTPHLLSLGAQEITRKRFEQILSSCHMLKNGKFNSGTFGTEAEDPLAVLELNA